MRERLELLRIRIYHWFKFLTNDFYYSVVSVEEPKGFSQTIEVQDLSPRASKETFGRQFKITMVHCPHCKPYQEGDEIFKATRLRAR